MPTKQSRKRCLSFNYDREFIERERKNVVSAVVSSMNSRYFYMYQKGDNNARSADMKMPTCNLASALSFQKSLALVAF